MESYAQSATSRPERLFMTRLSNVLAMSTVLLTTGCSKQLPSLQSPAHTIPTLDLDPPPEEAGKGRVAFDAENVKGADVSIVTERSTATATAGTALATGSAESTTPVCKAPCVTNLPYGNYVIKYSSESELAKYEVLANVTVGSKPSVVRANLGHKSKTSSIYFLGAIFLVTGASLTLTGAAEATGSNGDGSSPAVPLLVTGAVGLGIAALLMLPTRGENQAGDATQFEPSDRTIYQRR
jgi:hypothetical protein